MERHIPVLLNEVLSFLEIRPGMRILDGTLGLGGHAEAMLLAAQAAGIGDAALLGLDRDEQALDRARERLLPFGERAECVRAAFSGVAEVLRLKGWETVDFALADIGVSSLQLDSPDRGFSFLADGPLDMRMDQSGGMTAARLVNQAPFADLRRILAVFGEEPLAGRIAKAIVETRAREPILTTGRLARLVEAAYPGRWRATARNHPARRAFQALRMEVNNELAELEAFLRAIAPRLAPRGRLAVIAFHSLEDRLVKHFFRSEAEGRPGRAPSLRLLTRKPLGASAGERAANPRSRSARLRVAQRM
ncbi:MAG: 16S rRNA (cytosine(1402)-N(4))-methyltransferase RsmH [Desulfovibrio sp.]|jgi:16S rRNA (cytosine1402-N4)-methyltransferase|nr:16S rRNA (cytosine(1402)-N(4))-methyltransferase RsmH [Desulfovibrio sp.]